ncbi:MAG TPA: beta-L-arabinofuranosidase domain-containing protein [Jiangellaceae bacterium]|nr:beta-L-arabinofuranosidase domain-containing protein [Jiangellaceae bacterium]
MLTSNRLSPDRPHVGDGTASPVAPTHSQRRGISLDRVTLDPYGFWGRKQSINAEATLEHCASWMEQLGWLENFDRVARGEVTTERPGWQFSDSEVYKLLEAMAWQLSKSEDLALAAEFDLLVDRIAAAQNEDGYLGTAFGHPGLPGRYTDLSMGHELYNIGHLIQAAVARIRTVGTEDRLVDVARRAADHVCDAFGPEGSGMCGHPEIEVALVEFGRALEDDRYIQQARRFVERRGQRTLPVPALKGPEYFQDDEPVRSAKALRGHAVRALYLSAGAVDVAVETDDQQLLHALERQWEHTVARRTYITGGMGSRHQDEGFGEDWELPPDRAYCETCAGIAAIMFSWRLYLATGDIRYPDLIERILYNVLAASPSGDGRSFFYSNPLHQRVPGTVPSDAVNMRAEGSMRAPWFDVSCCPTNIARTLASVGAYFATADPDGLTVLQYASGIFGSDALTVDVQTGYPDDDSVGLVIRAALEAPATLRLRIPSWAHGASMVINGGATRSVEPGWAEETRQWKVDDRIELVLPRTPRFSWPHPRIDSVRGCVAVERGPLVLALESIDLPASWNIDDVRLDLGREPIPDESGAVIHAALVDVGAGDEPYTWNPHRNQAVDRMQLRLIPYHRWAERGPSTMRVFLPTTQ